MFSPGNLRATFDNPNYERLISHYIGEKYTLRYTGGMVPDVFQIIVKEKGVFTNVTSPSTKAKLRILFEVAPLALLVRFPSLLPTHLSRQRLSNDAVFQLHPFFMTVPLSRDHPHSVAPERIAVAC